MAKDMFFCCMDWKREDSHRWQKWSGLLINFQGIYVLTQMRTEKDQMYFCLFFYVLLVTIENSPIPRPVEIIWIVNNFSGYLCVNPHEDWGGSNVFLPFFYVLLVTIENSPIPLPVFPSSSSGVLSEKEEQEENRLLVASTGPTQQTRAIISQRNSSFSEKNFFQFLSWLNFLGNRKLTNN